MVLDFVNSWLRFGVHGPRLYTYIIYKLIVPNIWGMFEGHLRPKCVG